MKIVLQRIQEGKTGKQWRVVVIRAGESLNGDHYPAATLKEAVDRGIFEGVAVAAHGYDPAQMGHVPDSVPGGSFPRNTVGLLESTRFEENVGDGTAGVTADFIIMQSADWLRTMTREAWDRGHRDFLGFSIDGGATKTRDGAGRVTVVKLNRIDELTVVTHPAAGGRLDRLVAGERTMKKTLKDVLGLLQKALPDRKYPDATSTTAQAGLETELEAARESLIRDGVKENAETVAKIQGVLDALRAGDLDMAAGLLQTWLDEAEATEADDEEPKKEEPAAENIPADPPAAKPAADGASAADLQELKDGLALVSREAVKTANRDVVNAELRDSNLPKASKDRIREAFGKLNTRVTESIAKAAISNERDYLRDATSEADFSAVTRTKESDIRVKESVDRAESAMYGLLIKRDVDGVERFKSIHHAWRQLTGDTGSAYEVGTRVMEAFAFCLPGKPMPQAEWNSYVKEAHFSRVKEGMDTVQFAAAFGAAMNRRMTEKYPEEDQDWRKVSTVETLSDFRLQNRIRTGGFPDLPIVGENGVYQEPQNLPGGYEPGEENATYAANTRGFIYPVSRRAFINDDIGMVQRALDQFTRTAHRTLTKGVFNLLFDNGNVTYGAGAALVSAAHANIQAGNLSPATLGAAIILMMNQTELTDGVAAGETIDVEPKYLIVSPVNAQLAWELVQGPLKASAGEDATIQNWFNKFKMEVIVYRHASAAAVAFPSWFVMADPTQIDSIETGFINGQEQPELFIADQPTVGAMLTQDQLVLKVRHEWETLAKDHRGIVGRVA